MKSSWWELARFCPTFETSGRAGYDFDLHNLMRTADWRGGGRGRGKVIQGEGDARGKREGRGREEARRKGRRETVGNHTKIHEIRTKKARGLKGKVRTREILKRDICSGRRR